MTPPAARLLLLAVAAVSFLGARPFAGGWNDGSRLAAVESLADRGTFAVDDSVFVKVPPQRPYPYAADRPDLLALGTLDKLRIGGRFVSDKSPVPSVLLAGVYAAARQLGFPAAAERPDLFAYWLTLLGNGLPAVLATWGIVALGRVLGLSGRTHALYAASFAASTVLLAYTRHLNAHGEFLAAAVWLCVDLARGVGRGRLTGAEALRVGTLAGVGYALDLGVGPALLLALGPFVALHFRSARSAALAAFALVPWLAAHHLLNYRVGGTLLPANAVAEYLRWPGSPFDDYTGTGALKHTPLSLLLYLGDLSVGKKGFLTHNPPLLLALAGGVRLAWLRRADRPALAFLAAWCGAGAAVYALTSTNLSGQAASVRWFVPLLAPGYWALGLVLRADPRFRLDLAWLALGGVGPAALMWAAGPWMPAMVPGLWGWVAVTGVGWGVITVRHYGRRGRHVQGEPGA